MRMCFLLLAAMAGCSPTSAPEAPAAFALPMPCDGSAAPFVGGSFEATSDSGSRAWMLIRPQSIPTPEAGAGAARFSQLLYPTFVSASGEHEQHQLDLHGEYSVDDDGVITGSGQSELDHPSGSVDSVDVEGTRASDHLCIRFSGTGTSTLHGAEDVLSWRLVYQGL